MYRTILKTVVDAYKKMTVVGVGDKVTVIDQDVRFLDRLDAPNVEVMGADIRDL